MIRMFQKKEFLCLTLAAAALLLACIAPSERPLPPSATDAAVRTEPPQTSVVVSIDATPAPSPTPVPTGTPSPSPSPTPAPTPVGLIGGRYDVFSPDGTPVWDDLSYRSDKVSITITAYTYARGEEDNPYTDRSLAYFVADIYLQDLSSLRTAGSDDGFTGAKRADIAEIAARVDALLAVNGDFFVGNNSTLIIRNGVPYRLKTHPARDVCLLYRDGTVETCAGDALDLATLDTDAVWQGWEFGPYLIEADGEPRTEFPSSNIFTENPRTAFGYFEPGHYCFVVVDGRRSRYSMGLSLDALARLMADLGCKKAFNLDGGATSQLYWKDAVRSRPCGNRSQVDILYLVEPVGDAASPAKAKENP